MSSRLTKLLPGKAQSGYGLLLVTLLLTLMMMTLVSLQMTMTGPLLPGMQKGLRSATLARSTAVSALSRMRDQIQSLLDAGTAVNVGYNWSGSVSTPDDPANLAGSSTPIGTFTATVLKKSGNFFLVSATATVNGVQETETRLMEIATTQSYILDGVSGVSLAYGLRKLSSSYTGYAVQVKAVDSSGNPTGSAYDIGFTSNGDLDTATLLADLGVSTSPPLDQVSSAAGAYSLRKLSSSYAGSAIKVRRTSDNTTQDIGFTSGGDLDTTALTTFVGASYDGYVVTWYDQSGNGRDLTQSTNALQPLIVDHTLTGSTKVIMENNRPAIYFDGATHGSSTAYQYLPYTTGTSINSATLSAYCVAKYISGGQDQGIVLSLMKSGDTNDSGTSTSAEVLARYSGSKYGIFQSASTGVKPDILWQSSATESYNNTNNLFQATSIFTGTTDSLKLNGLISASASVTSNLKINYITVGQEALAGQNRQMESMQGKISEVIFYTANHSASDQALISKNQMYYYQIFNGAIGRVTKWYDQSGNGKDLTSVSTNNPLIVLLPKPGLAFPNKGQTMRMANTSLTGFTGTKLTVFAVGMLSEVSNSEARLVNMLQTGQVYDYSGSTGFMYAEESDTGYQPNVITRYLHPARNDCDQTTTQITLDQNFQTTLIFNGSTANGRVNGVNGSAYCSSGASTGNFNAQEIHIGNRYNDVNQWTGTISEVIVYPSNPTGTSTIESDQRSYFNTP